MPRQKLEWWVFLPASTATTGSVAHLRLATHTDIHLLVGSVEAEDKCTEDIDGIEQLYIKRESSVGG